MNLPEFQAVVQQNAPWFQGVHPESAESFRVTEERIGCTLPASLKWLLGEWGYSRACGVASLEEAVETTLRARRGLGLPSRYVILNDWGDGGVVLLDTQTMDLNGEYPVYWTGAHNLSRLVQGSEPDSDVNRFQDYPAWVLFRLEEEQEENT